MFVMIANRRRSGTISRNNPIRLPAPSGSWFDRPVTLPPGRANFATRPVPTGSHRREHDRNFRCRALGCDYCCSSPRHYDVDLKLDKLVRDFGIAFAATLRPAILDRNGATLDPAKFAQSLHESGIPLAVSRTLSCAEESDGR